MSSRGAARVRALKTALLRAVSHELRTPLTPSRRQSARCGRSGAARRRGRGGAAEEVSIETDRLDRLVSDLLDVSRLQAGTASTALDWCEVRFVRGAVAAARSRAPGRHIEIEAEVSSARAL